MELKKEFKDILREESEIIVENFSNNFPQGSKRLNALNSLIFYTFIIVAINNFRLHLFKSTDENVSWKNPAVGLTYNLNDTDNLELSRILRIQRDAYLAAIRNNDINKFREISNNMISRQLFLKLITETIPMIFTYGVKIILVEPFTDEKGRTCNVNVNLPPEVDVEVQALPEAEREAKINELAAGLELPSLLDFKGIADTPDGKKSFSGSLFFNLRPVIVDMKKCEFLTVEIGFNFSEGDPSAWSKKDQKKLFKDIIAKFEKSSASYLNELEIKDKALLSIQKPDRVSAIVPERFAVSGNFVHPIYGLSKTKKDSSLLQQFYESQTPLNWAVGLAMFSLTDEDRVRAGDWQEAKVADIVDRVFCLTERDAPRRGDQRTDILAEVVKLHTTRNWYYEIKTVRVGRAWTNRAVIGSQYAIPEIQLIYLDTTTGKQVFPTDAAVQELQVPLEVKGRRALKPDGRDIRALPITDEKGKKTRWKLEAIRWRWVQSFNDDLLIMPALIEKGKRKGLPKKTTTGKPIRKGYLLSVTHNIFNALKILRDEGPQSSYACRLLIALAHNLNDKREIVADRVFRMLGIPEDTHEKPEKIVARAIFRLKQVNIRALLPGSDELPRTDPNPERRKGPYYILVRSPDYMPKTGITSEEDALAIEAEYTEGKPGAQPDQDAQPKAVQTVLPGLESPPLPSGPDIRAAREAAGVNLRDFAKEMRGPAFKTWANYENGKAIRAGSVPAEVWQRVRDFVGSHGPKAGESC